MDSNSRLFNSIMSINKVIKYKMNGFSETNTFNLIERKILYSKIYVCLKILKKQVIVLIFEGKKIVKCQNSLRLRTLPVWVTIP